MADRRVWRLVQALHRGGPEARRSAGTVVSLRQDASPEVLLGADRAPQVAASREDIVGLLTDHQVAEPPAQTGAKERPIAASGC
jgi:hypothetical protein